MHIEQIFDDFINYEYTFYVDLRQNVPLCHLCHMFRHTSWIGELLYLAARKVESSMCTLSV